MVARNSTPAPDSSTLNTARRAARSAVARDDAMWDAVLVGRFKAGDNAAFVEIVRRYRDKMFHVAFGVLRNRADAEEIAQDTFVRAHRGLHRFRGDSTLSAWLYRIALNLSRNRYWYFFRRRRHATFPLDAAFSETNASTFSELVACDAPSPVREAANREFTAIVAGCMDQLTADQREILALRTARHQSYGDISRTLGLGIGTVKSRIARARSRLRALLATDYPEYIPNGSVFEWFEPVRSASRLEKSCA